MLTALHPHMMSGWMTSVGGGWFSLGILLLGAAVLLAVVAGIVVLTIALYDTRPPPRPVRSHLPTLHGAELILAERLARGEIDEAEFLRMRHSLLAA